MAESTVVKNFRDGTIVLKDGTGTPVTYTVAVEEGNLKLSGINTTSLSYEKAVYEDRGEVASVRKTKRKYPAVAFDIMLRDVSDASSGTFLDFTLKQNAYSANVSTLGANKEYTITVVLTIEGTDHGDSADHTITMADILVEDIGIEEGDPNKVTFSGRVLGTVTMT
jgi:hypothetical protein